MAVSEAPLEQTEHGLVCKGPGWFVVNAEKVRWIGTPGTAHVIVGGPCVVLGVGSRAHQHEEDWGEYVADPAATRLGAAPRETTADFEMAYSVVEQQDWDRSPFTSESRKHVSVWMKT